MGSPARPDSLYYGDIDRATREESSRLSELGQQETSVKREYGLEDATDPFSRANSLKQAFLARRKAVSAGLASQGQLYSGAHERALSRTRREEEEARAELRRSYEGAIGQIGAEKAGVKFSTEEERAQAFEDWLARAPEADVEAEKALEPAAQPGVTQAGAAQARTDQQAVQQLVSEQPRLAAADTKRVQQRQAKRRAKYKAALERKAKRTGKTQIGGIATKVRVGPGMRGGGARRSSARGERMGGGGRGERMGGGGGNQRSRPRAGRSQRRR